MQHIFEKGRAAIVLWLIFIISCGIIISRSQFTTDLSAFLPRDPTLAQQLLLEQIHDGLASRLILVGIEGSDPITHAALSKQIAQTLRENSAFVSVNNGEPVTAERDQAYLFNNRYLLSPTVTPERFEVEGLHAAISDSIDLLASPAGLMVKSLLPRDPTGEMMQLLTQLNSGNRPQTVDNTWVSDDKSRALLLIQTKASGDNTDAQQVAMSAIQHAFDHATSRTPESKLLMTGPGVFSVTARDTIKSQVSRLAIISIVLIASLLLLVYRSFSALLLGFLPVISGAVAGIAAVSLGFGSVHGITLGFGTALIGEAVDYSIYLFVQSEKNNVEEQQNWTKRFWPTIRLGVLTSIFGFSSLLLSGFPGLAQLGLYSIAGLVVAATVTRFVLPHLLPNKFRVQDLSAIGLTLASLVKHATKLRWPAVLLLIIASVILVQHRTEIWNDNISSLSPVSQAEVDLDTSLRADMGAPDVRYIVVVSGASQQSVLETSEQVAVQLQTLVDKGVLAGFESPSRYLPSAAMQRARQSSLPDPITLKTKLAQASQGLPVNDELFKPFIVDVNTAREQALLEDDSLDQTSMAMAVDALLIKQKDHWTALLPLTAPEGIDIDTIQVNSVLVAAHLSGVLFVDMKVESDNLYSGYLNEAIVLSVSGLIAIIGLLLWVFRSPMHVFRIITPLAAAVITTTAGLAVFGQQLIILHLVGLLLVVAVGSNYALFFNRTDNLILPRTLASMLFANLTTVVGFGVLAFANVAVLQAMGVTVAPGVILALIYSAIFARNTHV
jgi:predicted exporter